MIDKEVKIGGLTESLAIELPARPDVSMPSAPGPTLPETTGEPRRNPSFEEKLEKIVEDLGNARFDRGLHLKAGEKPGADPKTVMALSVANQKITDLEASLEKLIKNPPDRMSFSEEDRLGLYFRIGNREVEGLKAGAAAKDEKLASDLLKKEEERRAGGYLYDLKEIWSKAGTAATEVVPSTLEASEMLVKGIGLNVLGTTQALIEGKSLSDASEIGAKAGGEALTEIRVRNNQNGGKSILGTDEEFANSNNAYISAVGVVLSPLEKLSNATIAPVLETLDATRIELQTLSHNIGGYVFGGQIATYGEYRELEKTDDLLRAAKISFKVGEAAAFSLMLGATKVVEIIKPLAVSLGMGGGGALSQELMSEEGFKLDRFLENSVVGAADSMVFMGALGGMTKMFNAKYLGPELSGRLARGASLTVEEAARVERSFKLSSALRSVVDFVDSQSDLKGSVDAFGGLDTKDPEYLRKVIGAWLGLAIALEDGFDVSYGAKSVIEKALDRKEQKIQYYESKESLRAGAEEKIYETLVGEGLSKEEARTRAKDQSLLEGYYDRKLDEAYTAMPDTLRNKDVPRETRIIQASLVIHELEHKRLEAEFGKLHPGREMTKEEQIEQEVNATIKQAEYLASRGFRMFVNEEGRLDIKQLVSDEMMQIIDNPKRLANALDNDNQKKIIALVRELAIPSQGDIIQIVRHIEKEYQERDNDRIAASTVDSELQVENENDSNSFLDLVITSTIEKRAEQSLDRIAKSVEKVPETINILLGRYGVFENRDSSPFNVLIKDQELQIVYEANDSEFKVKLDYPLTDSEMYWLDQYFQRNQESYGSRVGKAEQNRIMNQGIMWASIQAEFYSADPDIIKIEKKLLEILKMASIGTYEGAPIVSSQVVGNAKERMQALAGFANTGNELADRAIHRERRGEALQFREEIASSLKSLKDDQDLEIGQTVLQDIFSSVNKDHLGDAIQETIQPSESAVERVPAILVTINVAHIKHSYVGKKLSYIFEYDHAGNLKITRQNLFDSPGFKDIRSLPELLEDLRFLINRDEDKGEVRRWDFNFPSFSKEVFASGTPSYKPRVVPRVSESVPEQFTSEAILKDSNVAEVLREFVNQSPFLEYSPKGISSELLKKQLMEEANALKNNPMITTRRDFVNHLRSQGIEVYSFDEVMNIRSKIQVEGEIYDSPLRKNRVELSGNADVVLVVSGKCIPISLFSTVEDPALAGTNGLIASGAQEGLNRGLVVVKSKRIKHINGAELVESILSKGFYLDKVAESWDPGFVSKLSEIAFDVSSTLPDWFTSVSDGKFENLIKVSQEKYLRSIEQSYQDRTVTERNKAIQSLKGKALDVLDKQTEDILAPVFSPIASSAQVVDQNLVMKKFIIERHRHQSKAGIKMERVLEMAFVAAGFKVTNFDSEMVKLREANPWLNEFMHPVAGAVVGLESGVDLQVSMGELSMPIQIKTYAEGARDHALNNRPDSNRFIPLILIDQREVSGIDAKEVFNNLVTKGIWISPRMRSAMREKDIEKLERLMDPKGKEVAYKRTPWILQNLNLNFLRKYCLASDKMIEGFEKEGSIKEEKVAVRANRG